MRTDAFIDGRFVPAAGGRTFATVSPRDGSEIAPVARGGPEDIDRAVAAARRAFERCDWAYADPAQRGRVLVRVAELMTEHLDELGRLESTDTGHPIGDARGYGLAAALWTSDLRTAGRLARRLRAGTVWVNTFDASSMATPFGGFKDSGHGRDRSLHALEGYTQLKTTWISLT